jgi:hypothetical protein
METIDINNIEHSTIKMPKYTWRCQLHPGTYWSVEDHRVPNRFHRWMQKLCFGVVWEKIGG